MQRAIAVHTGSEMIFIVLSVIFFQSIFEKRDRSYAHKAFFFFNLALMNYVQQTVELKWTWRNIERSWAEFTSSNVSPCYLYRYR
jgi:hypothetical protein